MYGRNGSDKLGNFLAWTYFALVLIYTVVGFFWDNAIFTVLYIMVTGTLIFFVFFRMFSKNLTKRRKENERFCNFFKLRKTNSRTEKLTFTANVKSAARCSAFPDQRASISLYARDAKTDLKREVN